MTVAEGVAFIRSLLDESRFEQFGRSLDLTTAFYDAMQDAVLHKAREYWYRGEKEALMPEWVEETLTGIPPLVMSNDVLFIESVRAPRSSFDTLFRDTAVYVPPERYVNAQVPNPALIPTRSGRFEYTWYNGGLHHNSDQTQGIRVSYIRIPTIDTVTPSNQMPLAEYTHGAICDKAASILYQEESPNEERAVLGNILDLTDVYIKRLQEQQAQNG